ncbi:MAG: hypothetical protein NVSMB19_18520 [Vulcanimicrobiaceae bacterium]
MNAHDEEIAGKNNFVNDPTTASYFWNVVQGGAAILSEYDPCDCADRGEPDPVGHVHKIAEWPGKPSMEFAPVFKATEPFKAWTLVAEPEHLSHQSLPTGLSYEIGPDDAAIWGHRMRFNTTGDFGGSESIQIFGVEHADGRQEVTTVYANGAVFSHASYDDALGHSPSGNPHELNH